MSFPFACWYAVLVRSSGQRRPSSPGGDAMKWLLGFFVLVAPVFAQLDTGTIVGTLHDPSGAVLGSATVTFTAKATNAEWKVTTDDKGEYVSPPLRVGTYTVRAEANGFKSQTKEDVTLQVQDRLRVDFDMVIGAITENVLVSGEAPPV